MSKHWTGVYPAVTTEFTDADALDIAEMERCFKRQLDAGVDGLILEAVAAKEMMSRTSLPNFAAH